MQGVPARTERQEDILEFVALIDELDGYLRNAIAAVGNDAAIWRAAGRFEMCVERLLDIYDDVRRVKGDAKDTPGLLLLDGTYPELLDQARAWLDEILDFADARLKPRASGVWRPKGMST